MQLTKWNLRDPGRLLDVHDLKFCIHEVTVNKPIPITSSLNEQRRASHPVSFKMLIWILLTYSLHVKEYYKSLLLFSFKGYIAGFKTLDMKIFILNHLPGENRISEITSFLCWKETRSSRVSALTIKKLPSFRPTANAFPSGEKQQHLPPTRNTKMAFRYIYSV